MERENPLLGRSGGCSLLVLLEEMRPSPSGQTLPPSLHVRDETQKSSLAQLTISSS